MLSGVTNYNQLPAEIYDSGEASCSKSVCWKSKRDSFTKTSCIYPGSRMKALNLVFGWVDAEGFIPYSQKGVC